MALRGKNKFFTVAEADAWSRKVNRADHTAPDLVLQKLDTAERAVGGMKNKFLDKKARRNPALFAFPCTYPVALVQPVSYPLSLSRPS
jgi:hypothetical protein